MYAVTPGVSAAVSETAVLFQITPDPYWDFSDYEYFNLDYGFYQVSSG